MVYTVLEQSFSDLCLKETLKLRGKFLSATKKDKKTLVKEIMAAIEKLAVENGVQLETGWKKVCENQFS
jgi:hypothetical protein